MVRNARQDEDLLGQKRIYWLFAIIFVLCLIALGRLFQKSVLEHGKYTALAENQYTIQKEIPALRGQIFARDETAANKLYPLATSMQKYSLSVIPRNVRDAQGLAKKLSPLLGILEEEIFNKINNKKLYIPPLKKNLDKKSVDNILNLKEVGVLAVPEEVRFYPEGELAAQVLGFVNAENIGKYGIEGYYNSELKGQSGRIIAEKDTKGRLISKESGENALNGSDLLLSIDHNVQYFVENTLKESIKKYGADNGSVIVVEPSTGAVLAMASAPSFDPNKYNEVPEDKQSLFLNPAISLVWEPGSVFKTVTMSAALSEGKIEPDTTENFSNMVVVDGYEIHTAQDKSFGHETMTQCLENSDNVCLAWVGDKLGNDLFYHYIEAFGFGQKTGIDLSGETSGSFAPLKEWRNITRSTLAFGQGVSTTPLQMAMAISAIANGGKLMKPSVVENIIKPNGDEVQTQPQEVRQVISSETASKIAGMMVSVVENGHGKKAQVPGYKVAGKTGTAQVPNPEGGYYEDRHIGSFCGFFPADNPQFAMVVKLDNPKNVEWAESSAAPTFGEIAGWLLNYYQIPPSY